MSRRILVTILILALSPVAATVMAQNLSKSWDVPQLMAALAKIKTYESEFIERKRSSFLTKEIELKGSIFYQAPDVFVKHTTTPFDERVSIDGDTITIEKPEDDQLQQQISPHRMLQRRLQHRCSRD